MTSRAVGERVLSIDGRAQQVADAARRFSADGLDAELLERLTALIADPPLDVHIAREFTFEQIPAAHYALGEHHLGKLAIVIG